MLMPSLARLRGRGGEQIGIPGEDQATWSPDGRRIVYECGDEICTMRSDRSNPQTLACCPSETLGGQAPQWSPGGTIMAYWSDDQDVSHVYVLDLTSGAERAIMASAEEPVWASEDTLIVRTWALLASRQEHGRVHERSRDPLRLVVDVRIPLYW